MNANSPISLEPQNPEIPARSRHQTATRIRVRIPQKYHQEPIISKLCSEYGLQVNIIAAVLGSDAKGDGWFDLLLKGLPQNINSALIYLSDLDVEVWGIAESEVDGY